MKKHISPRKLMLALALTALFATEVKAEDASKSLSAGVSAVAASPLVSVVGHPFQGSEIGASGSVLIIEGIVVGAGNLVEVSMKKVTDGSLATLAVSGDVISKLGLAVGQTVTALSEATGYSLIYAGQILAFVPNSVGQSLLEHSRVSEVGTPEAASHKK